VAGTLIGFTAYTWLLQNAPISKVVTHQYVNPLVAILLGAVLLDEQIALTTGLGAALIVGSVFVAVRRESPPPALDADEPAEVRSAPADQAA
jgi:drug/metabolite transporter (DMT)-like permease